MKGGVGNPLRAGSVSNFGNVLAQAKKCWEAAPKPVLVINFAPLAQVNHRPEAASVLEAPKIKHSKMLSKK
jgi:hypothetical protein